jgi:hypothetical protein
MRIATVLLLVVLRGAVAVGQTNPYPTGCYSFITEEVDCSDYDEGSCRGHLDVYSDINGGGTQDITPATLQCNNSCGAPSPNCPSCANQGPFLVAQENPACECTGNPGFVCSAGTGGGSNSPICSAGQWTCNGAAECPLPPSGSICNEGEYGEVSCGNSGWYCWDYQSPIIVDTTGTGFHLTNAANGVRFDLPGDGRLEQIAWTAPGSTNGWLALPRDGKITSGKELFGNFTPQPPSSHPNGFLALAMYDKPENGGNGDGVIDWHDAVWDSLRVWIDANHDGISQPEEPFTLPAVGIISISLSYRDVEFADQFGNQFRYKGAVNPRGQSSNDPVDRTIYDVFLSVDHRMREARAAAPPPSRGGRWNGDLAIDHQLW